MNSPSVWKAMLLGLIYHWHISHETMSEGDYKGPPRKVVEAQRKGGAPAVLQERRTAIGTTRDAAAKFPHRMTVGAHQRMAELDFDPLEWSVKICKGEALTTDHPFLKWLLTWKLEIDQEIAQSNPVDWDMQVEEMLQQASKSLTDSWVPLEIRSGHIKELLNYLYPKLKAVEHTGSIQQHIRIKPLQAHEVSLFKEKFEAEY